MADCAGTQSDRAVQDSMSKHDTPSDNSDGHEDDRGRDRWEYDGNGNGQAVGEFFDAGLMDHPTTAIVYPVQQGDVHLGLIVGEDHNGKPRVQADISLSPDDAEGLALDILESVTAAREERNDE